MEHEERRRAEDRLALLELVMNGHERRHEVVDAVWDARDEAEAAQRLRQLLEATADPRVVLDMRLGSLTTERRGHLAREVDGLRRLLRDE